MPIYDSVSSGEKAAIIFDIGTASIKCGFAGEANPRFILPSPFALMNLKEVNLIEILKELIHRLCYRYLIVNPKDRRIVLVESIMTPTIFKNALGNVLFMHFEVPSILFTPAHVVSLFTLGIPSALVLDCGYNESIVLPVLEGFTILKAWQSAPLGSKLIHSELTRQIRTHGFFKDEPISNDDSLELPESLIEDIKVKKCFVSPVERANMWNKCLNNNTDETENVEQFPLPHCPSETFPCYLGNKNGGCCLNIPFRIREIVVEGLFTGDEDNITIPRLILDSLLQCPLDCRRTLIENIICIGGTCMLPGFLHRINEELKIALELPRYASLAKLKDHIKFHSPPSKPNYTAWLGAAIFGALEILPARSYKRASYLESKCLPDWSLTDDINSQDAPEGRDIMHSR